MLPWLCHPSSSLWPGWLARRWGLPLLSRDNRGEPSQQETSLCSFLFFTFSFSFSCSSADRLPGEPDFWYFSPKSNGAQLGVFLPPSDCLKDTKWVQVRGLLGKASEPTMSPTFPNTLHWQPSLPLTAPHNPHVSQQASMTLC